MKRFLLRRLIVISNKEKGSREISFFEGLNIIIGRNKTGKSSLIKSIFHTLGCGVKLEPQWKKLIEGYVVVFSYGEQNYLIYRQNNEFSLFFTNQLMDNFTLIKTTSDYTIFCEALMNVFEVRMTCVMKKGGQSIRVTPPVLFLFQYIDQDTGWSQLGKNFSNIGYLENAKDDVIKYVVGYQDDEFFKTKEELARKKKDIEYLNVKVENFNEFIDNLHKENYDENIDISLSTSLNSDFQKTQDILQKLSELEKIRIEYKESISSLQSQRYEKYLSINNLKLYEKEISADYDFALQQEENLLCPFCGTEHKNTLLERSVLVADLQSAQNLIKSERQSLSVIDEQLNAQMELFNKVQAEYKNLRRKIENLKAGANIIGTYKNEGKQDMLKTSEVKMEKLLKDRNLLEVERQSLDRLLESKQSKQKRDSINKELKSYYQDILKLVNISSSIIQFRNFMQTANSTGSELPRIIYAYHVALYLFNLKREAKLFNWLVIDTPNQQGQDEYNIENIHSVFSKLATAKGQVIIGTERETGYEDTSNTVMLDEFKRCLTADCYVAHRALFEVLDSHIFMDRLS